MLNGRATVQVKSFDAIELNAWYGVKGHETSGVPLPDQYIFIKAKNPRRTFFELDSVLCHHYMIMFGQLWFQENHTMQVPELNVGKEHGIHDIHLERMEFEQVARELAHATGKYREIMQERNVKGIIDRTDDLMREIQK